MHRPLETEILENVASQPGTASCPGLSDVESDSRPIKILVIIPNLDLGGAETDLVRNLPLLKQSQVTSVVFTLFGGGLLAAELSAHGIRVVTPEQHAPSGQGFYDWVFRGIERWCRFWIRLLPPSLFSRIQASGSEYIRLARSIARCADDAEVDVIHAILPGSYLAAVLANLLTETRRPLVMSRLSLNWYQRERRLFAVIERFLLHRRVDLAVANSQAVLRELRLEGIPERKLRLIYNGIDAAKFADDLRVRQEARNELDIIPEALVFSAVGNLFPYKGHADLLNALGLIKNQLPASWLLLVAGLDMCGHLDALRLLADKLDLSQNVRLLGQRRDIPIILSAADIHVSPSHHEGFPNNVLEAMCARLPIVATAVGGVPEQVIDGVTGILVPAQNPPALSKALLSLAYEPDLRTAMGLRGQRRVQLEFPITRSVSALKQTYESLTSRSRILSDTM